LTSDKNGQWACDLDHPYRLIFQPQEKPIPTNIDGQYLSIKITGVEILKIEDYH
jgi:proteic killer suppression protein